MARVDNPQYENQPTDAITIISQTDDAIDLSSLPSKSRESELLWFCICPGYDGTSSTALVTMLSWNLVTLSRMTELLLRAEQHGGIERTSDQDARKREFAPRSANR